MMFADSEIVTGLDIGTSQVTAIVAEVSSDAAPEIIGIGQANSRGVRKGEIVRADLTVEDIRIALDEAEEMADVEIRGVCLGVTGGHIRGFINRGSHPVVSAERDITEDDVRDVIRNAKAVNLPYDHDVIHMVRQQFLIDGQAAIQNPVGLLGARIEVDLHVIHGQVNRLNNSIRAVRNAGVEPEKVVFTGLASMMAVLDQQQKELGTLVLDYGGGTIEYVVCRHGLVRHSGVLSVGGDHISNDLAYGLKVALGRAEELKIECGSALNTKKRGVKEQSDDSIDLNYLRKIMSLRVKETLELIEAELAEEDCLDRISEVVVTGGCARIRDILSVVEQVFEVKASSGQARNIDGPRILLEQPEFSTAIGLAKFGSSEWLRRRDGRVFAPKFGRVIKQLLRIS